MFTPEQMQQLEQLMDRKLKRNRQSLMRSIRKEFNFTNGYFDRKTTNHEKRISRLEQHVGIPSLIN